MPLTPEERQKIYDEESAKRKAPKSPTDQLSSLILGCLTVIGLFILAVITFLVGMAVIR